MTAGLRSAPQRSAYAVFRLPRAGWSLSVDARAAGVTAALLAGAAAVFLWSLAVGEFPIPLKDVAASLTGDTTADSAFIVRTLRLPRGLTALLVGAAFGASGAIFQRIVGNPLASPDVIGINAGAAAAAVFAIVVVDAGGPLVVVSALGGALGTAATIYALSYRRGVSGYRLVLVGIGITAVLSALSQYLLTRAEIFEAQRALVWLTGSLNGRGWEHAVPLGIAVAVLVPLAAAGARQLRMLELGDDTARALGVRVEMARGGLLVTAVALAAVATAAAGPVAFVALVAPQITRRLAGGRPCGVLPAAACGALLVVAADLAARRVFAPTELPVGIATAVLGAPYLLWLLARANRIGEAG